jgi:hypothetical protein
MSILKNCGMLRGILEYIMGLYEELSSQQVPPKSHSALHVHFYQRTEVATYITHRINTCPSFLVFAMLAHNVNSLSNIPNHKNKENPNNLNISHSCLSVLTPPLLAKWNCSQFCGSSRD